MIVVAAVLGLAFAFVTPPFEAPDEVFHFWRPMVMAQGQLLPERRGEPDAATLPVGMKTLVYVFITADGHYTAMKMREAASIPLQPEIVKPIRFPAWYTPVAYLPQTLAALVTRIFTLRPLVAYYLGRLFNLAAALALTGIAMRIAPAFAAPIAAAALLPMTLSQFASWSADALTIALAFLFAAMLVSGRVSAAAVVVAFFLALCKPAYFLVALLVLVTRSRPALKTAVIGASAIGTALAFAYARLAWYVQRIGDPIDPHAQLQCLFSDPMRFVRALGHDLATHARLYVEQAIGRFGNLGQVGLPAVVVVLEVVLLVGVALTSNSLSGRQRVAAALIVVASSGGIVLSQYLTWSVACGEVLEGVQGRYFLPILPLALAACALPQRQRWRVGAKTIVAVALIANLVAIAAIARHFW